MRAYTLPFKASGRCLPRRPVAGRAVTVVVRADSQVQELLARDRKQPKLANEFGAVEQALKDQEELDAKVPQVKSKKQRRDALVARSERASGAVGAAAAAGAAASGAAAGAASGAQDSGSRYKRCKDALDAGLALFGEKKYQDAIAAFNLALELPGNGAYRLPSSPREYSCPSDAEEQAALYNMACCYTQMGQKAPAITCLEAVLDNGFEDYATIRSDPDLAPLRGRDLDGLLDRYDGPLAKLRKALPGGNSNKGETGGGLSKPWLIW